MKPLVRRRSAVARPLLTGLLLLIGPLAHAEEMTWEQLKTTYHAGVDGDIEEWKERGFRPPQVARWIDQFASQEFIKTLGDEEYRLGVAALLSWMEVPIEQWGITVKTALKAMKEDIQPFAFMLGKDPSSLGEKLESHPLPIAGALLARLREVGSPAQSRRLIQACNQMVHHKTFLANPNVYANKGKCTSIQATVQQMTASNEGLFTAYEETEATRGYFKQREYGGGEQRIFLTFDKPFTNQGVHGLARIEGNYTYTSQAGWQITVPHLRMIAELHSPPPGKDPEGTGTSE